ncbi:recombination mediator RecR [Micavibrio aeruginosavorus]|uniref:Recombination protein RecR n=1 Tax=Micavibrio aeruginosavorus (strain ARL-13) TaxID=856793 RepID=G2KP13_MICAA|nr:recombination mediator RecR [Micavibrio aeruginosavorus]AEP08521.1 recombination protein RecR [Micavibrio aeruginosavorus ARL-13]
MSQTSNYGRDDGPMDQLIRAFANLPGLGPRSARRIALHLLSRKDSAMKPLAHALDHAAETIRTCSACGNLDMADPCRVCQDTSRNARTLCVVSGVSDLWAIERTGAYKGRYHILGGLLSALDGIGPQDLRIASLLERVRHDGFDEIILALAATVDGQATAHYITDRLHGNNSGNQAVKITRLAHGIPVGGDLDYLDDGTIATALKSRA